MTDHLEALEDLLIGVRMDASYDPSSREKIAALKAAIALMRGQSWQPISTAPRDGSEVLISNFGRSVVVASYERDYGGWCYRWHPYDGPSVYGDATHWQPLPTPPKDTADEQ